MVMTIGDGILTDPRATAATILAHRDAIVTTWLSLLSPVESQSAGAINEIITDQLDAAVVSFAGYLLGEDLTQSPMALRWRDMRPSGALVADATVALGLFVEALRQSLFRLSDLPFDAAALVPAASCFIRDVTLAVLQTVALEPNDAKWLDAVEQLERARVQRTNRIAALTEIARAVSTTKSPDDLFEEVHAACSRIISGDDFAIGIYDQESRAVVPRLVYIQGKRRHEFENRPIAVGLLGIVAETREPLAVPDYLAACAEYGVEPIPAYREMYRDSLAQLAWMGAPMVQRGKTIGVISVFSPLMPFDQDDVALLTGIAGQTAVALDNSLLISRHRRRAAQLKAINQLARRVVTLRDVDTLLSTAVELIHDLFGYALVSLFLVDQERHELLLRAHSDSVNQSGLLSLRIPIDVHSIVGAVAATGQPAVVGDVAADPRYFATPETAATRSELAVPLLLEGRLLGVLDVQSLINNAFDDHDVTTLRTIADQIAIALENARLFKEEQERSEALALMLTTTRAAGSSLLLEEVLPRLAEGFATAAGVPNCAICLVDEDDNSLVPAACVGGAGIGVGTSPAFDLAKLRLEALKIDDSPVIQQILDQQAPFFCCEIPEPRLVDPSLTELIGGMSALAVPLAARGRIAGIAFVIAEEAGGSFSPERIRLIQGVADSAGLAIENARLFAQSQALAIAEERGRLAQEIHDTIAQGLTAISLHLDLADAYLPKKPEQAAEKVRRALDLTRQNLEEARRSVLDLRAAKQHQTALPDALRRLVQTFASESGVDADFSAEALSSRLSARVEMGLYRIAEEALTNVRRHATASRVQVKLVPRADEVCLTIQDNGAGFDQESCPFDRAVGFGLTAIRERAKLLKGTLDLQSKPGEGTTIRVTLPFEGMMSRKREMESQEGRR